MKKRVILIVSVIAAVLIIGGVTVSILTNKTVLAAGPKLTPAATPASSAQLHTQAPDPDQ